jgi:hypothetical protein
MTQNGVSWLPFSAEDIFVQLVGPSGKVSEAVGRQDRSGHFVARLVVPAGGVRDVRVGIHGECSGEGCSGPTTTAFIEVTGIGPAPPIVPADELEATLLPLPASLEPGEADVVVRLALRPGVVLGERRMPSPIVLRLRNTTNGSTTYAAAFSDGQGQYHGSLRLPSAGQFVLDAGTGSERGLSQVFANSSRALTVGARPVAAPAVPAAAQPTTAPTAATSAIAPALVLASFALGAALLAVAVLWLPSRRAAIRRIVHL